MYKVDRNRTNPFREDFVKVDCAGDMVKPVIVCILSVLLGQMISVPTVALAGRSSVQGWPHTDSMTKYVKHQKKEQKRARKSQRRAEKHWKKDHHTEH